MNSAAAIRELLASQELPNMMAFDVSGNDLLCVHSLAEHVAASALLLRAKNTQI